MAKKKLFGIPAEDRADAKQQLQEWRAGKRTQQPTTAKRSEPGAILVMVLNRPSGFEAGVCARLFFDPQRSFVWDINLIGYPAISGRAQFRLEWSGPSSSGVFKSKKIPIYATADEFAANLPDDLKKIAIVQGGTMSVVSERSQITAQTGRWFVSFEDDPGWTPKFIEMTDPRIQGRCLRTRFRISQRVDDFVSLASVDGPSPIHPGSLGIGWQVPGAFILGPIEARIYQEYQGGVAYSSYSWRITPFIQQIVEGNEAAISIELSASNQDRSDGPVVVSVLVAIGFGDEAGAEDFAGTLDDWILAAIASDTSFTWADGRLSVTIQPDEEQKLLEVIIPTIDDAVIEGNQEFSIILSSARSSTGIVVVEQSEANVEIVDADNAKFGIYGPSAASNDTTVEFTLSVQGVFQEGVLVSVFINETGTALPDEISEWRVALAEYAATVDGLTFDTITGRLDYLTQASGGMPGVPIVVGLFATSVGRLFGLELSSASVSGGGAIYDDDAQSIEFEIS